MLVPVQNIYYLLSYAWNRFVPGTWKNLGVCYYQNIYQFYAWWLIHHLNSLSSRDVPLKYQQHSAVLSEIKGKIDLSHTLKRQLHLSGKAYCHYSQGNEETRFYQIVKSTLHLLLSSEEIDTPLKHTLQRIYSHYEHIGLLSLHPNIFRERTHRKYTQRQHSVLHLCEVIFHQYGVKPQGTYQLVNFFNDPAQFPQIFERFVRNFYKKHAEGFQIVGREFIPWDMGYIESGSDRFPRMETDVTLVSDKQKIIIETKYKAQILNCHYRGGVPKFHSKHLYQLFSYLKNVEVKDPLSISCKGILLYPSVDIELDETAEVSGHQVRIFTLNLNRSWEYIHADLLMLIQLTTKDKQG